MTMLEEFEVWATEQGYGLGRYVTDLEYDEADTQAAWEIWQECSERTE